MMASIISKTTREVWKRRIKGFWLEFSHNKTGIIGLAMVVFFVVVAVFAPYIAPYSPKETSFGAPWVADQHAFPDWITIFPGYQDVPPQIVYKIDWNVENQDQIPSSIKLERSSASLTLYYNASKTGSADEVTLSFNNSFTYTYEPMKIYSLAFNWAGSPDQVVRTIFHTPGGFDVWGPSTGSMDYMLKIELITPNGTSYAIWDQNWWQKKNVVYLIDPAFWNSNSSQSVALYSSMGELAMKLGYEDISEVWRAAKKVFSLKGVYTLRLSVTFRPARTVDAQGHTLLVPLENATGQLTIASPRFTVWGRRFGLLGTDGYNHDVFSQVVIGTRVSIIIGVSAAVATTLMGVLIGVTAGYLGGGTDELLMRACDIVICIPLLPLLLVFVAMFGYSTYYLVLLLTLLGWPGLARVIRSQVLSIREMSFIESAVASGGTKSYIIGKHIVPNTVPIAASSLVLSVPGAIILEAALSFIGMGDPNSPTWGKVLYVAEVTGAFSPSTIAWWEVIPAGLAITLLCLSFVFIGHAVDEIVNPRLRRRR
jgi:peptide/nickel transport system permease protein